MYHGYRFQKYRQSPFSRLDITVFNDDGMANQWRIIYLKIIPKKTSQRN